LKGNSDIRNYVLNNAWPNYVPGQGPELQMLEKKVKNIRWYDEIHDILPAIPDPWTNPNIILMQKSFNPVPVWDIRFDEANKLSNEAGEWPVVKPELIAGRKETRQLAVFNDEFSGDEIKVTWELRLGSRGGRVYDSGEFLIVVPFGEFRKRNIDFIVPGDLGDLCLALRSSKGGEERYSEDLVCFSVVSEPNT
jgi:hypothetical protein